MEILLIVLLLLLLLGFLPAGRARVPAPVTTVLFIVAVVVLIAVLT